MRSAHAVLFVCSVYLGGLTCSEDIRPAVATCGDGACNGSETCASCATDCGSCNAPHCGDGACNGDEFCGTCQPDCGPCPGPDCGDGMCAGTETCANCVPDCACATGTCSAQGVCLLADAGFTVADGGGPDGAVSSDSGLVTDTGFVDSGFPPTDSGFPPDSGLPLPDSGLPPPDSGFPPADSGFPPADSGLPPADSGQPPADSGLPPADSGFPPADSGLPVDTGVSLPDSGFPPADSGIPCGTECDDLVYTACTCGLADPCSWSNDGYCDLEPPTASCAVFQPHFDDSQDCAPTGEIGSSCESTADCTQGTCYEATATNGWINGYCLSWTCYDTTDCPTGSVCLSNDPDPLLDIGYCVKPCSGQSDCRTSEGYACLNETERNGGPTSVCVPYCDQTRTCPATHTCDMNKYVCVE